MRDRGFKPAATNFMAVDFRVYVLRNSAGRFYIALSENSQRRLQQHNDGISRWTKAGRPWRIVWQSESLSLREARQLENKLKRPKGGIGFSE
jgi:putative endonuclease